MPTKNLKNTAAGDFFKSMGANPNTESVETLGPNTGHKETDLRQESRNEATVSISLPKKSREAKLISLRVNVEEYTEFSKIVKELGYKNSEVLNHFIRDFIKANRKKGGL